MSSKKIVILIVFLFAHSFFFLSAAIDESSIIRPTTKDLPKIWENSPQVGNEIKFLDDLIATTALNLENQKVLKKLLIDYVAIQNQYVQNVNDQALSMKMVKTAHQLLEKIKELNLTHIFDAQLLSELTFFSQIAVKQGVPEI
jgi:hypothetical protein